MQNQPLTPLKPTPVKTTKKNEAVLAELEALQAMKKEQSKQMASEIRALTVKRNFLLKQIKELSGVTEKLRYEKKKLNEDIDKYAQGRMEELGAVGGLKVKVVPSIDIDPNGIMK